MRCARTFYFNFQNHREHFSNNLCKFHRNLMNGVCPCRESATPGTPACTIFKFFKFPKAPRECLQQLVKVSSQSDERCGLLYGTYTERQTDRHSFLYIRFRNTYTIILDAVSPSIFQNTSLKHNNNLQHIYISSQKPPLNHRFK